MRTGLSASRTRRLFDALGRLPLLAPMSEVAGRMSVQVGAHYLEKHQGGSGVLLGGVAGVRPGQVVILGGGVSGTNAARMAMGLEAEVIVIDRSIQRLRELELQFGSKLRTVYATADSIEEAVSSADLIVGAVLIPGAAAPKLVTREMIGNMRKGSVLVDISIDQGGCFETSHPTTHSDPTCLVEGVVHYCVTNMPGAFARTSTVALGNATLPFALTIANKGLRQALADDRHLRGGLNIVDGQIAHEAVATSLGLALSKCALDQFGLSSPPSSRGRCKPPTIWSDGRTRGSATLRRPPFFARHTPLTNHLFPKARAVCALLRKHLKRKAKTARRQLHKPAPLPVQARRCGDTSPPLAAPPC
jgi:alanine dehydrogenase